LSEIEIRPLSAATLDDFLAFFDHRAFSDNPQWSSCYCQCFYENHSKIVWSERTGEQNRARACERAARGEMRGYLAYLDGEPIGWCSAAPRALFHALDAEPVPDLEAARVGEILCFVVAPEHRGRGVARRLLRAACDGLRAAGLEIVEANPRPQAKTAAANHFGPLSLYLSEGFAIHRTDADGSVHVRRQL
jgi:GNAT superfamily N-acetyltransferase